ncbi:MAG: ribonuclease P protein component [Lentimicrobiaceae bacterium]|jgi:ribonuclease P protein component|nr:ribonuclease P protein component [Lentimicrobiaceae bacterium]
MQTFRKQERLSGTVAIELLFTKGNSLFKHPVRLVWRFTSDASGYRVLFSIPKRNFHRAVDRNRIRRLMRECYRKNKHLLHELKEGEGCDFAFLYSGKTMPEYKTMETIIIFLLQRLNEEYAKTLH